MELLFHYRGLEQMCEILLDVHTYTKIPTHLNYKLFLHSIQRLIHLSFSSATTPLVSGRCPQLTPLSDVYVYTEFSTTKSFSKPNRHKEFL